MRRFETGSGGLVNDVAFAPNGDAYATDSRRGLLFRIPARALAKRTRAAARLKPFLDLSGTPVGQYANGLVAAGDRYLLVVGTATGALVRIDLKTKRVREVRLPENALAAGDGLARSGHTLYAVNSASRVTQVLLAANWLSGAVRRQITSPRFQFPTTVQIAGRRLLVVNSQFNRRGGTPDLPFTVAAVPRRRPKQAARPPAQGSP